MLRPVPTHSARRGAWILIAALALPVAAVAAQTKSTIRPLEVKRVVLPNGLVVLLNEDRSSPIIAVHVLYHVGRKDEPVNNTGMSHLCEHLMGEGSPHVPGLEKQLIQTIGGSSPNFAITDEDRTQYYYTVPSNQLETALWMESDRMATPLSNFDGEHFRSNREIVRQERLQNRENVVFGDTPSMTLEQFFVGQDRVPRDGPATTVKLDNATPAEVKQFCLPYYVPNNAILALSGDFRTADAEELVRKYFGPIPRAATPSRVHLVPNVFTSEKRVVVEDARAKVPRLRMAWFSAGFSLPDRLALNALAAMLAPADSRLGQLLPGAERAGRLSKLLIYDRQLATSVTAGNVDMETAGIFQIEVTPRGNASLGAIETLVDSVLADLKTSLVSEAELLPYRQIMASMSVTSLQTRLARADTLAQGEAFTGDPLAYAKQAERTLQLKPTDVRDVARKYLVPARVVMSMIPAGRLDLISKPELPFTNITPVKPRAVP